MVFETSRHFTFLHCQLSHRLWRMQTRLEQAVEAVVWLYMHTPPPPPPFFSYIIPQIVKQCETQRSGATSKGRFGGCGAGGGEGGGWLSRKQSVLPNVISLFFFFFLFIPCSLPSESFQYLCASCSPFPPPPHPPPSYPLQPLFYPSKHVPCSPELPTYPQLGRGKKEKERNQEPNNHNRGFSLSRVLCFSYRRKVLDLSPPIHPPPFSRLQNSFSVPLSRGIFHRYLLILAVKI